MMNNNDNDCLYGRAPSPVHDDTTNSLHEMAAFYSEETHIAPSPPSPPRHAFAMLPEATASQHLAMDEFIKDPSNKDRWQQLVEDMRRDREQQMMEFQRAHNGYEEDLPPSEMRDEMEQPRKSSMLRNSSDSPYSDYSTASTANDSDGDEEQGTTTHPESHSSKLNSSKCAQVRHEMGRQRTTMCIFTLGFLLGILIVGLSFAFIETPEEELHALEAYEWNHNIGDSRDINNITSQGGSGDEDEENENEGE